MEIVGLTAIAIGLINVGSTDPDVSSTLLQKLLEISHQDLSNTYSRQLNETSFREFSYVIYQKPLKALNYYIN